MRRVLLALAVLSQLTLGPTVQAQGTALPSVEDFTRTPPWTSLRFSPDGTWYARRELINGRMNLVAGKVAGGAPNQLTNFRTEGDVAGFAWISDNRLVFNMTDLLRGLGEDSNSGGLWVVDADGRTSRKLADHIEDCVDRFSFVCRFTGYLAPVGEDGREIIVVNNDRNLRSPDLYRLDVQTNRRTILTQDNPGEVSRWILDAQLVPRAAVAADRKQRQNTFWFKDSATAAWRKIASFRDFEPGIQPLAFGPDGTLYVASGRKSDKTAVYKFDAAKGEEGERLVHHKDVDIDLVDGEPGSLGGPRSPLIFDSKTKELIGIRVDADKPEIYWLRDEEARVQRTVDGALPGAVNAIRKIGDNRYAISSYSDREPSAYYVLDTAKRQLIEIGRPRAWIKPAQMGRTEVVRYKARDGLEIPSYLTLPAGKEAKNLPLVAWIHGGPWARDDWGWEWEVQFMASRGYAVFQPNYRGSTGFGQKHLTSSFKKLGQEMQNDVTDGIEHLIKQGTVDRNRVCIGGGSYGGYATMMGLVREPQLFKCGINVVGVTDLFWWLDLGYTDFNQWDSEGSGQWLRMTIGDPATDGAMMRANSPRLQADKIKAPVLFIHGAGDLRVPIKHAEGMRDALKERGVPFEWVVYPEEGHGFRKEANRTDYLRRIEAFLLKHLGPGR